MSARPPCVGEACGGRDTPTQTETAKPGRNESKTRLHRTEEILVELNTEVDIPLLRKAVEWAEAEAAKPFELCGWHQPAYMKSAIYSDSGEPASFWHGGIWAEKSPEINGCGTAFCIAGWVYAEVHGRDYIDDEQIDTEATRLLGLSGEQSCALFAGCNSIEDVRRIAEDIAGERL